MRSSANASDAGRAAFFVLRAEERPAWHGIVQCRMCVCGRGRRLRFVVCRPPHCRRPVTRTSCAARCASAGAARRTSPPSAAATGKTGIAPLRRNRGVSLPALHQQRETLVGRAVPRAVVPARLGAAKGNCNVPSPEIYAPEVSCPHRRCPSAPKLLSLEIFPEARGRPVLPSDGACRGRGLKR